MAKAENNDDTIPKSNPNSARYGKMSEVSSSTMQIDEVINVKLKNLLLIYFSFLKNSN